MVLPTTTMKQNTHLIMPMRSENKNSNGGNGWSVNLHVEFQKKLWSQKKMCFQPYNMVIACKQKNTINYYFLQHIKLDFLIKSSKRHKKTILNYVIIKCFVVFQDIELVRIVLHHWIILGLQPIHVVITCNNNIFVDLFSMNNNFQFNDT